MFPVAAIAAFVITLTVVPSSASAQDLGACFRDCQAYTEALPAENETPAMDAIIASCRADVPTCLDVDDAVMRNIGSWCSGVMTRRTTTPPVTRAPRDESAGFCVLPDGSHTVDEAGHRCGCPAGTWPIKVERHRSVDRLRSLGVPQGSAVFICANSMALQGTPGSPDARINALVATVAAHDEALRALCDANANPALTAICTEARRQFLASGSQVGPVDLGPLLKAVENLTAAVAAQDVVVRQLASDSVIHATGIAHNTETIETISDRVDALTECIQRGTGHRVTYTDSSGVTHTYTCPELLETGRREIVETVHRETIEHGGDDTGSHSFILAQAFGNLTFTQLRYGNTDYGLPRSAGVELTLGIPLGGVWDIRFGGALGGAWPNVPGVTNVFVMPSIGFGYTKPISRDVHFSFGFGGLAALRFLPDGSLAHNVYAPYVGGLFRFGAQNDWSPVLGFRLYAGVAPYAVASGTYEVPFTAGGILTLGFGHF